MRDRHFFRFSISVCIRPQNDSMTELSKQSPIEPIDATRPDSTRLWGHRLLQQLDRPPGRSEVGLELGDPFTRCDEFDVVGARDAFTAAGVDQMLVAPVVDRLAGDAEIGGNGGDGSASVEEVEDLPLELPRIGGHIVVTDQAARLAA